MQIAWQTDFVVLYAIMPFAKFLFEILAQIGIGLDWVIRNAIVATVEQLEEVAENLRAVAAVYLLDDKEYRLVCLPSLYIGIGKGLRNKLITNIIFKNLLTVFFYYIASHIAHGFL